MRLDEFQHALDDLRRGALDPHEFSRRARALALPEALPARFAEVLADLLDRMDASALFREESCSFSQTDLLDALQVWVDKVRARVAGAA